MKFGPVDIDKAEGCILAHSANTPDGKIKKGRRLSRQDIAQLGRAGVTQIVVAALDDSDIDEDSAAAAVASSMCGRGARKAEAFTGRVNIFAADEGVLLVNRDRLLRINGVDESVTVATLQPFERVSPGQMIATVKIIPFAVAADVLANVQAAAAEDAPIISVAAFQTHNVGLVLTDLPGSKPSLIDKRSKAIIDRVKAAGSVVGEQTVVAHTREAVRDAATHMRQGGLDPILIFGASAIVDREDVIPGGISDAGGDIVHLGMPVDPGNLLLLAKLGTTDVIGVPSCASSPKVNGLDWVLERLLANLPVTGRDVSTMAAGGLLMEIPSRPQPRTSTAPRTAAKKSRYVPNITAIVLASGQSSRMGDRNKLLERFKGQPLVRHAAKAASASEASSVIVVTGHQAEQVEKALQDLPVSFVRNEAFKEGLASSLVTGITAVPDSADGAIVLLGDMPLITANLIDRMIAAFDPKEHRSICISVHKGRRGNPVLWSSGYFEQLRTLKGDTGARHLIAEHAEELVEVEAGGDEIFMDIDTPEAFAALRAAHETKSL